MTPSWTRRLESIWYAPGHPMRWVLAPLELAYRAAAAARKFCYRVGLKRTVELSVPVIVVGNISVGGTGKTPCVIWLANELKARGYRVGVVSRGYGSRSGAEPRTVDADSDPADVGDEPVLIASAAGVPVVVASDRVAAARALLADRRVDILIADDGLQHLALARQFEIAVVDGERGLGNGACLPAGPLREPPSRLKRVDAVIVNGPGWGEGSVFRVELVQDRVMQLVGGATRDLADFRDVVVHAVAGIGHPERYFAMLRAAKLRMIEHAFPDHATLKKSDFAFADAHPILMTAKDAVKCKQFADPRFWVVEVKLEFERGGGDRLLRRVLRDL